jgi:hypothetical protein
MARRDSRRAAGGVSAGGPSIRAVCSVGFGRSRASWVLDLAPVDPGGDDRRRRVSTGRSSLRATSNRSARTRGDGSRSSTPTAAEAGEGREAGGGGAGAGGAGGDEEAATRAGWPGRATEGGRTAPPTSGRGGRNGVRSPPGESVGFTAGPAGGPDGAARSTDGADGLEAGWGDGGTARGRRIGGTSGLAGAEPKCGPVLAVETLGATVADEVRCGAAAGMGGRAARSGRGGTADAGWDSERRDVE